MVFSFLKNKIQQIFLGHPVVDDAFFEELEISLIQADVGSATTALLIEKLKAAIREQKISAPVAALEIIKKIILEDIFDSGRIQPLEIKTSAPPRVILVLGVNGSGKTTFIAKLVHYLNRNRGTDKTAPRLSGILLASADTFRPAAIEQLEKWAARLNVDIISHKTGSDPAAVVFDSIAAARSRNKDIIIVDTAGRLHTKVPLMDELKKIIRVIKKEIPDGPDEILLTIDATTGQNAFIQAKTFHKCLGLTGIVLTKIDGTAKGGIVLAIKNELKIPIKFSSSGETIDDLKEFQPEEFVSSLLGTDPEICPH